MLALAATYLLWDDLSSRWGLLLWLAAVVALVVGFWSARPVAVQDDPVRAWFPPVAYPSRFAISRNLEILILALIIVGALVVRIWDFSLFPNGLQSDEGNNGIDALKWLSGAPYTPYSESNEGQASLFTYLIALGFAFFGPTLEVMRSVSALVGVATVLAFYFLVRDQFTTPAALAGTALLAFSRWHITFSRIIYELILTPLALVLLFYFLHKALRDGRLRDFVLAGLAFAFGFNTYTGFRTAPIGVGLLLLYWLIVRRKEAAAVIGGSLLFAGSALIGLIPLAIYAIQRPDVVFLRTSRLNILGEMDAVGSLQPLWTNLRNYLLMYNLRGDPVTINNLPGAPAVAAIVGGLGLIGLVYALRHINQPRFFLAFAWIGATLPAGILSVTLESPSSRRVIGMLPLVFLLVTAVIDAFWRSSVRTWHGRARWLWSGMIVGLVASAGYADVDMFFTRQTTAESVQMAFSPVESSIARYMAGLDKEAVLYVNQGFRNHSAIQFIALNPEYRVLDTSLHLPLPEPHDKPVIYILSLDDERLRFLFEQFYPGGVWQQHTLDPGPPLFNTFTVTSDQQHSATGLLARLTPPGDWQNSSGPAQRTDGIVPPQPFPAQGAGIVWSGSLRVPLHGIYSFRLEGADNASLLIDGAEALADGLLGQRELIGGFHDFLLSADLHGQAQPQLFWGINGAEQPLPLAALFTFPASPFGLTAVYYPNAVWGGEPFVRQRDIVVTSTDGLVSPYSVVWTGELQVDVAGPTSFGTNSDDGSLVYVDGQLAVDNGGSHGAEYQEGAPLELSAGRHPIEIRYFQDGGSHRFELYWSQPGQGRQLVPPDRLFAGNADSTAPTPPSDSPVSPAAASPPAESRSEPTVVPVVPPSRLPTPLSTPLPSEETPSSPIPTPAN